MGPRADPDRPGRVDVRRRFRWSDDGAPASAPATGRRAPRRRSRPSTAGTVAGRAGASSSPPTGATSTRRRRRHPARPRAQGRALPGRCSHGRARRPTAAAARAADEPERIAGLRWFHVADRAARPKLADPDERRRARRAACCRCSPTAAWTPTTSRTTTTARLPAARRHPLPRFGDRHPALGRALHAVRPHDLDPAEKKTLVFTDSVQDAAHRAGFVQSRSHSLTLRSVLREAVGDERCHPRHAGRPCHRSAPGTTRSGATGCCRRTCAEPDEFAPFWEARCRSASARKAVRKRVATRLLFDARPGVRPAVPARSHPRDDRHRRRRGRRRTAAMIAAAGRQALEDGGRTELASPLAVDRRRGPRRVGARRPGADARAGRASSTRGSRKLRRGGRQPALHLGRAARAAGHARLPDRPHGAGASPGSAAPASGRESVLDPVTHAAELVRRCGRPGSCRSRPPRARPWPGCSSSGSRRATSSPPSATRPARRSTPSRRRRSSSPSPTQDALIGGEHLLVCDVCQDQMPGSPDGRRPARRCPLPGGPVHRADSGRTAR